MTWWLELYDQTLADMLLVREDAAEVDRTLVFLERALELKPGSRVFDQCCGIGSLALPLAERGHDVIGCDLGIGYVERARLLADERGLAVELHHADALTFVPSSPCDGAFNWWTSFGYAEDDLTNVSMLRCAARSLRPGGRFALDFMNVPGVLANFHPRVETRRMIGDAEVLLVRESRVDAPRDTLVKTWTFLSPDGPARQVVTEVRLYTPARLRELLLLAGFAEVEFVGEVSGAPLDTESPRCIALARKGM